ncbi:MAG: VOC family protein [Actinomycetota bacterium]|nr:VOC family protein [Actinomycetota bacterium]
MTSNLITGVDFVSVPTKDLDASVAFYGETLGLPRSVCPSATTPSSRRAI